MQALFICFCLALLFHKKGMDKYCPACDTDKPIDEFTNNRSRPDGKASYCKLCTRQKLKERRQKPDYPEKQRFFFMQWKYGLTQQEFRKILALQEGKCAVCGTQSSDVERPGFTRSGKKNKGLVVDHDHNTGAIRGLLCDRCNRAIGLLRESAMVLAKAAAYVEKMGLNYIPERRR